MLLSGLCVLTGGAGAFTQPHDTRHKSQVNAAGGLAPSEDPAPSPVHPCITGLPQDSVEIVEDRTETAKTFIRPDGRRQAIVSAGSLHYEKDGAWKDIDTRWQPYDGGAAAGPIWAYQMVDANYRAYVRNEFGEHKILRLEKNSHFLEAVPGSLAVQFSPDETGDTKFRILARPQSVTGQVSNEPFDIISGGGFIEWPGAYGEGMDFRYTPSNTRFIKILEIDSYARIAPREAQGLPAETRGAGNITRPQGRKTAAGALAPLDDLASPVGGPDSPDGLAPMEGDFLQLSLTFSTDLNIFIDGRKWDGAPVTTGRQIDFKDREGGTQWWWEAPVATDAAGGTVTGLFTVAGGPGPLAGETREKSPDNRSGPAPAPEKFLTFQAHVQFPLSWLKTAVYPVRVDPITAESETTDCDITGTSGTYSTARSTSSGYDATSGSIYIGQNTAYNIFRSF
ncbi:MAG: hypothetical protein KAR05_12000, partial [Candidatus Omnitrophica bacterium]|nr:hypothetical protein [Candidatus Omnitrophota bacterium]